MQSNDGQTSVGNPAPPAAEHGTTGVQKRRIAFTSMAGTLIEFYDFIIYGIAASLVFPRLFFPEMSSAAGTLASFATFGVAFIARPVGGVLFGHYGDRLGRKKILIITLMIMGVATVLIGLLPTAAEIGLLAPVVLVVLRLAQGLAAGGEWAGANLFVTEHAPKDKRGFWAVFPQLGATFATTVGNAAFLVTGLLMSDETFLSWGWRIPFLASALLVGMGLYIRLKIDETPVFTTQVARTGTAKLPLVEAFRTQPREIIIASGVGLGTNCFFYVSGTYLTTYAVGTLQLSRSVVLLAGAIGGLVLAASAVTSAILSDRVGRRRMMGVSSLVGAVWALLLIPVLDIATPTVYIIAMCVTFACSGFVFGPMGAFLPELFRTRYRFTASAVSYNVCTVIAGSITPLVGTALATAFGPIYFGILLAALCALGALCIFSLRETNAESMHYEH